LKINFSWAGQSGGEATFSSTTTSPEAPVETHTQVSRIFEPNNATRIDGYRFAGFQILEHNGTAGIEKGDAAV